MIFLEKIQEQLISEKILEQMYENILINEQQKLSESEIDIIQYLYRHGCEQIPKNIKNHNQILAETSIEKIQKWKQLKLDHQESLIWISH